MSGWRQADGVRVDHAGTDPLAGTKYRIVRELGSGGMGNVYEVEHIELGRPFVAKVMREALAKDPKYLERFRLEAQALAAFRHPNVVEVTDFGRTAGGSPYFIMERLIGVPMSARLQAAGTPPVADAIDWTVQALEGVEAAHRTGIVHRDIKPGNLFLAARADGSIVIKVLDFGIAKLVDASKSTVQPSAFATEAGVFMGTPQYVSPEQGLGKPIDARADVYGMGLVLYRLLAGRGPFDHVGRDMKLVAAHITRKPDPPSVHAANAVPPELDSIVLKALEKDPAKRYQSVREMADALRTLWSQRAEIVGTPSGTSAAAPTSASDPRGDRIDERTPLLFASAKLAAIDQRGQLAAGNAGFEEGSDTIVDVPTFESDAYFAPRALSEHEATLILDDDTYDPFVEPGTTHTALPASHLAGTSGHSGRPTLRVVVTLTASAIATATVVFLLLRLLSQ